MSLRDSLLGAAKKPNKPIVIDGVTYFLRQPTIGAQESARLIAGATKEGNGNMAKFSASLLIYMAVDEGNKALFTAADLDALLESDVDSPVGVLMLECGKLVGEANKAGKNSTAPTEPA